jgi:hypothetical protein
MVVVAATLTARREMNREALTQKSRFVRNARKIEHRRHGKSGARMAEDLTELEHLLCCNPEDAEAWHDYSGELALDGDVRGELVLLEQAAARGEAGPAAIARVNAIIEMHAKEWLGDMLVARIAPGKADTAFHIVWKHGFAIRVRIDNPPHVRKYPPLLEQLRALLDSPAARLLACLEVCRLEGPEYRGAIHAIGACPRPSLRELTIGDRRDPTSSIRGLEALHGQLPWLESLQITAGLVEIGRFQLPRLRHLVVESECLRAQAVKALSRLDLPQLQTMEIRVGTDPRGLLTGKERARAALFKPLFESSMRPCLKRLALRETSFTDGLIELLVQSTLAPRLEALELSGGNLTGVGASWMSGRTLSGRMTRHCCGRPLASDS